MRLAASSRHWPRPLSEAACIGLAAEIVQTLEPHTESDPAALLLQFLVAFGNAVNGGPHFMQERTRHTAREFVAIVGQTAKARKGTSWDNIKAIMQCADPRWCKNCLASGLGSGEGVVARVRDPQPLGAAAWIRLRSVPALP